MRQIGSERLRSERLPHETTGSFDRHEFVELPFERYDLCALHATCATGNDPPG